MVILYIILIILALLIIISLLPARLEFLINSDGTVIDVKYVFIKLRLYPSSGVKENSQSSEDEKQKKKKQHSKKQFEILKSLFGDIIKTAKKLLSYIIHHAITIENIDINAKVGTSDPADTGIICGGAYASIFQVLGFIKQNMKLKKYNVKILPDFDNCIVKGRMYAVLRTNIAHIIVILFIVLKLVMKYKKLSRRINK